MNHRHTKQTNVSATTTPTARRTRSARRKGGAKRARREVNYHSRSTAATLAKQNLILEYIAGRGDGMTVVEVAQLLGCSRQLALYHVKKMVATSQLVMVLEPCRENGGVRFRCWDVVTLARRMASIVRVAA